MLIDDFEEFSSVVEAPLARLKVKKFVKQRAGDIHTSITADDSKVYTHTFIHLFSGYYIIFAGLNVGWIKRFYM